eukprot:m51a1_g8874 hypothetical protein (399) ;mRNA; f:618587-619783
MILRARKAAAGAERAPPAPSPCPRAPPGRQGRPLWPCGAWLLVLALLCCVPLWCALHAALACSWPPLRASRPSAVARLALVADPHAASPLWPGRRERWGAVAVALDALYVRLVCWSAGWPLRPDAALVLGDLVASEWMPRAAFEEAAAGLAAAVRLLAPRALWCPGNHDVGYSATADDARADRWRSAFGPLDHEATLARTGHRVVVVDAPALDGPEGWGPREAAWAAVEAAGARGPGALLATHIPLGPGSARRQRWPGGPPCDREALVPGWAPGSVREQTHLSANATARLVAALRPSLVVSGHEHDGCLAMHRGLGDAGQPLAELTVRSVQGDWGGNVGLLSLGERGEWAASDCALGLRMRDLVAAAIATAVWVLAAGPLALLLTLRCCARGPKVAVA